MFYDENKDYIIAHRRQSLQCGAYKTQDRIRRILSNGLAFNYEILQFDQTHFAVSFPPWLHITE